MAVTRYTRDCVFVTSHTTVNDTTHSVLGVRVRMPSSCYRITVAFAFAAAATPSVMQQQLARLGTSHNLLQPATVGRIPHSQPSFGNAAAARQRRSPLTLQMRLSKSRSLHELAAAGYSVVAQCVLCCALLAKCVRRCCCCCRRAAVVPPPRVL